MAKSNQDHFKILKQTRKDVRICHQFFPLLSPRAQVQSVFFVFLVVHYMASYALVGYSGHFSPLRTLALSVS